MSRYGLTANRQWFPVDGSAYEAGSQRGRIYAYIAANPGCMTPTISEALGLEQLESRLAEMERTGAIRCEYAADLFR